MNCRFIAGCLIAAVVTLMPAALVAGGGWLDREPVGGCLRSDGLSRAELAAGMDRIERDCAGRPLVVARTRELAYLFENVRLGVNTNDLFVHWFENGTLLTQRTQHRVAAFAKSSPARRFCGAWCAQDGAFTSRLDTSHTCPDWKSVLELGPAGLAARARKRRKTAANERERLFLDCVAESYDALVALCRRWADFADEKGMREVAAVLRENAAHPPRTLREALQLALVYDRAQEAEGEDVRSQGLFDRLFIGYCRADIAAGRETRQSVKRLVADYYTRLWTQGHPNGKNIAFGGYDAAGIPVWNELTEIGFEVFRELGRINPKLTYRFGKKTPQWQIDRVMSALAAGKTAVVFACEETLAEAFRRRGKEPADITDYVLVGCYEPGIGGREIIASMSIDLNLAKPLEMVFARPDDKLPKTGDEYERAYLDELEKMMAGAFATAREVESHWYELHPAPLFSGSFRDCIANARDAYDGGCRYNSSGVVCTGIGTVADTLAAVRHLVDVRRAVTMPELAAAVRNDWKGRGDLRLLAHNAAPKWGNNDNRADDGAKRVYDFVTRRVNAEKNGHGGNFQAGFWSIYLDIEYGKCTAATADGRRANSPLSRNNVATDGCGKAGASALMLSNLKLDMAESPDGHIMDLLLPASMAKGDPAKLASVVMAYFRQGGQCLHLNCFDSETLVDAQRHPERYADLQVRVCGWNVRWNDLSRTEQDHFIATARAQEGR